MAGWPCRGAPRGLAMSARSVALTPAVVPRPRAPRRRAPARTSSPRRSSPPPPPAVAGASVTVVGLNFNPGGVFDELDDEPSHPEDPDLGASRGRRASSPASRVPPASPPRASTLPGCSRAPRPPACLTASWASASWQRGVDARFFHADDAVVHFPPGEVRAALGLGLWSAATPSPYDGRAPPRATRSLSRRACVRMMPQPAGAALAAVGGVRRLQATVGVHAAQHRVRHPDAVVAVADAEDSRGR